MAGAVKAGDVVCVHYRVTTADGDDVDNTLGEPPVSFVAGGTDVLPSISHGVIGMSIRDKRVLKLTAAEAFGERFPKLARLVPRAGLPKEVTVGSPILIKVGSGQVILWVTALDERTAMIDANHPQSGKALTFEIQVVSIDS